MKEIKKHLIPVLLLPLLFCGTAFSKAAEQSVVQKEGQKKLTVGSALIGEERDALDLLIIMSSIRSARRWNRSLHLSQSLKNRLSKYEGKVKFNFQIRGVNEPFQAEGAKITIPAGAEFGGKLTGLLSVEVYIVTGEVGVLKGEVFVREGTKAVANGGHYKYAGEKWTKTGKISK